MDSSQNKGTLATSENQHKTQAFISKFNKWYQEKNSSASQSSTLLKTVEEYALQKDQNVVKMIQVDEVDKLLQKNLQNATVQKESQHKNGILIIGPPGIGKTAFMKYYAIKHGKILIHMSCCELIAGLKEQMSEAIQLLFQMANFSTTTSQTILFFDEIDMLFDKLHQFEQVQRGQVTLLKCIARKDYNTPIVYSTNRPWKIQHPQFLLSIYYALQIPMLTKESDRKALIEKFLFGDDYGNKDNQIDLSAINTDQLAKRSQNFTNSDIYVMCRQIMMQPISEMLMSGKAVDQINKGGQKKIVVTQSNKENALKKIKASMLVQQIHEFTEWRKKFEKGLGEVTTNNKQGI